MKIKELNTIKRQLGLRLVAAQEVEVDPTSIVVDQAFTHSNGDYRAEAYGELLSLGVGFSSNTNILTTILQGLITVHCPYCDEDMKWGGGSGNSEISTNTYRCPGGHGVSLTLTTDGIHIFKDN